MCPGACVCSGIHLFPQEAQELQQLGQILFYFMLLVFSLSASQSNFQQILDGWLKLCLFTVYFVISILRQI